MPERAMQTPDIPSSKEAFPARFNGKPYFTNSLKGTFRGDGELYQNPQYPP